MTDWSTDVSPLSIVPSTGIVSPGRMRSRSPRRISSAGISSSLPPRTRRPCVGARPSRVLSPFLARLVVASSKMAPMAMMKATSPAANRSPMAMAANMAMLMSSAEEILLTPGLWTMRQRARYSSGSPLMHTVTQAGSKGSRPSRPVRCGIRSSSKNAPPASVIGTPARKSVIRLSMRDTPLPLCAPRRLTGGRAGTYTVDGNTKLTVP